MSTEWKPVVSEITYKELERVVGIFEASRLAIRNKLLSDKQKKLEKLLKQRFGPDAQLIHS